MNNLYDNGAILLGTKKDIVEKIHNNSIGVGNNAATYEELDELYKEILEDLKGYKDDTIIALNYDNGMGYSFDYWEKEDIIE